MSLNHVFVGIEGDLNIRNGKTSSAITEALTLWAQEPDRPIFSNIELIGVPYTKFSPENLKEFFSDNNEHFRNAIVILDELSAIVHKNDKISPTCKKHPVIGLCYLLTQFFRQVGKLGIDTFVTGQVINDIFAQARQLMNITVYCELEHQEGNRWIKCLPHYEQHHRCPDWHYHRVKQQRRPSRTPWSFDYCYIEPFVKNYNSYELVRGWMIKEDEKVTLNK
jgi:hypothetical protein